MGGMNDRKTIEALKEYCGQYKVDLHPDYMQGVGRYNAVIVNMNTGAQMNCRFSRGPVLPKGATPESLVIESVLYDFSIFKYEDSEFKQYEQELLQQADQVRVVFDEGILEFYDNIIGGCGRNILTFEFGEDPDDENGDPYVFKIDSARGRWEYLEMFRVGASYHD